MGWASRAMSEQTAEGDVISSLREHLPVLGKVAMALVGDGARIEAILEEVARQAGETVEPPRLAKPWLLGLVRVACAKAVTKLPIKTRGFETASTPEAAARAQLASLKPTEREAVILSIIGRLNADDLATACNVDVATAKQRLSRALEQMMTVTAEGSTK
jgi:DNA-directed RNA polymerase specialized sigma24 family protein